MIGSGVGGSAMHIIPSVRSVVLCVTLSLATPCVAAPMRFEVSETGGNKCCRWVQASGEITAESAKTFEAFVKATEFVPGVVRLDSPGGSLVGGIALGEAIRTLGFATEVGSSSKGQYASVGGRTLYSQEPGSCASACAYAFLGGVERVIDSESRLGFHRFYVGNALDAPTAKLFSGKDLDDSQRLSAALLFYVVKMGVDARLVVLASSAAPNEVKWISPSEAVALRVVYQPHSYKPWQVEPYGDGAIAVSESNDGLKRVVAGCSKQSGPYVAIINLRPEVDEPWLNQCRQSGGMNGAHSVFGASVAPNQVQLIRRKEGGFVLRFQLPGFNPPLTSPELLTANVGYHYACHTNEYQASTQNFVPAVRLALRNCYRN